MVFYYFKHFVRCAGVNTEITSGFRKKIITITICVKSIMLWSAEVKRAINVNGTTTNQKIINIKDNKHKR